MTRNRNRRTDSKKKRNKDNVDKRHALTPMPGTIFAQSFSACLIL